MKNTRENNEKLKNDSERDSESEKEKEDKKRKEHQRRPRSWRKPLTIQKNQPNVHFITMRRLPKWRVQRKVQESWLWSCEFTEVYLYIQYHSCATICSADVEESIRAQKGGADIYHSRFGRRCLQRTGDKEGLATFRASLYIYRFEKKDQRVKQVVKIIFVNQ